MYFYSAMKNEAKKLFRFLRTKPVPVNTNEILALERTKLANERTLLSYIRSSLYLLLGGLALLQLEDLSRIHWLGYIALLVCVVFLGVGIIRYIVLSRRLYKWNRILFVDTIEENIQKRKETEVTVENQEAKNE
ncbi:DUF202 domain-containing protein [Aequorivita ciconiae]|nr:DUF202 domain-containing protein [Aequorivita sp. H23M31]